MEIKTPALPWMATDFIEWIEPRLKPHLTVFEFGSGGSTLWLAQRTAWVTTVEHSRPYYDRLMREKPANVTAQFIPLMYGNRYMKSCRSTGRWYDLIVVDGMHREDCIRESIDCLNPEGVMVLDDSEREAYQQILGALCALGYQERRFFEGTKSTSVLYQPERNWIGI